MRSFSNEVLSLLDNDELSIFTLVVLLLNNGTHLYHTTLPYDVTIGGLEGGQTFLSNNNLMSVDAPRLSNAVDREAYKITYSDNDRTLMRHLENGAAGSPCRVYFGFFNTTSQEISGTPPGHPITSPQHIVLGYKGILDTFGYVIDTEVDVAVALECSSPMASLDLINVFKTSDDSMRNRNSSDNSFDQVHTGSSQTSLVWGKR
jgi:hypothetical protein